ncbi:MAG: hypothetical protein ACK2T0_00135 [Anaerolineales bacterium]
MASEPFKERAAGLLLVLALMGAACSSAAAASSPTVTVSGKGCTYSGPKRVSAKLSITWDVKDGTPSADYSFILTTLPEGKTVADLEGLIGARAVQPPSWLKFTRYSQLTAQTTTETFDLAANAAYHGEPLYVLCLGHQVPFAVAGPVSVSQ